MRPTPITILLVVLFVVLYIIGTYSRFNYLDFIYKGHPVPVWCVICLLVLFALLWKYNRKIGILYGILILFQLKRIIINTFVGEDTSTTTPNTLVLPPLLDPDDDRIGAADRHLRESEALAADRFKTDDVKIKEILRQIQSELDFDPYKTPLAREIIMDVYQRYFNNDMFVKLQEITENSKQYQKQYKLLYMPQPTELKYSVDVANLLAKSRGFGVNPQIDKPLGVGDTTTERA